MAAGLIQALHPAQRFDYRRGISMTSAELTPLAKSKIKTRAAVKGMTLEQVQKLIDNLNDVLASVKKKEETRA